MGSMATIPASAFPAGDSGACPTCGQAMQSIPASAFPAAQPDPQAAQGTPSTLHKILSGVLSPVLGTAAPKVAGGSAASGGLLGNISQGTQQKQGSSASSLAKLLALMGGA